jgi:hypothetical protein
MSRLRPDARKAVTVSYKAVDLVASMIGGLLVGLIFNRAWSVIEQGMTRPSPPMSSGAGGRSCSPPACRARYSH